MKYDLELLKKGNHYIKLETQEKYDEVMQYMEDNGVTWCGGEKATHKPGYWKIEKSKTILYTRDGKLSWGSINQKEIQGLKELKERKMTNKDKILKAVENISDDKAKEILAFLGHKESKRFVPDLNENYHYILSSGDIAWSRYVESSIDLSRLSQGNAFKTEEEAQFEVSKRAFNTKAYWEFADNSDEIDWNDASQVKYSVYFNHYKHKIGATCWYTSQYQGAMLTTNKEWLEQWVKDNESDIKKFWFNKKGE